MLTPAKRVVDTEMPVGRKVGHGWVGEGWEGVDEAVLGCEGEGLHGVAARLTATRLCHHRCSYI